MSKISLDGGKFITLFQSENPDCIFCGSPSVLKTEDGSFIATFDLYNRNPKADDEHRYHWAKKSEKNWFCSVVMYSQDGAENWRMVNSCPMMHARPFLSDKGIYILGHNDDLMIIKSEDGGKTWTGIAPLTHGQLWHQAPCNVHYESGYVYIVMEKMYGLNQTVDNGWPICALEPILMRGRLCEDLTLAQSWTFSAGKRFCDFVDIRDLNDFGIPFYPSAYMGRGHIAGGRVNFEMGWLETNIVKIEDPEHQWYDERGKTFHLFARAHTGMTNTAAVAKIVEHTDGSMTMEHQMTPSGRKLVFVHLPGGQMKFHILYDKKSKLYWLVSTQATDSMRKPDSLPKTRYSLPDNERNRLVLHYSKNCMDWIFVGMVAKGETDVESRHYASMTISGEDLHILSRSGSIHANSAHNTDMITLHIIKDFRYLIY